MKNPYLKLKKSTVASIFAFTATVLFSFNTLAQEKKEVKEESEKGSHKITVGIGQAHVHEKFEDGSKKWLTMSSLALNYDYRLSDRWSVGLHNDLILENFTIEKKKEGEAKALQRENPIASKIVFSYSPIRNFSLMAGSGEEFERNENLFLSTVGAEYGWHTNNGWEFGAEIVYDIKWNAYDTWIVGFGISKVIEGKHRH